MNPLAIINRLPLPVAAAVFTAAQLLLSYLNGIAADPIGLFDGGEFITVAEAALLAALGALIAYGFVWLRDRLGEPTSAIMRAAYTALEAVVPIAAVVSFGSWADVITFGQAALAAATAAVLSLIVSWVNAGTPTSDDRASF